METTKTGTYGQRKLVKALELLGFEVTEEARFGPYTIDAFVEELQIAFEADGPIHKLQKKHDAQRDRELVQLYGVWKVVRLTEDDLATAARLDEALRAAIEPVG